MWMHCSLVSYRLKFLSEFKKQLIYRLWSTHYTYCVYSTCELSTDIQGHREICDLNTAEGIRGFHITTNTHKRMVSWNNEGQARCCLTATTAWSCFHPALATSHCADRHSQGTEHTSTQKSTHSNTDWLQICTGCPVLKGGQSFPYDCYFFNIICQENMSGHTWRQPRVEFINSHFLSGKHKKTAEYNVDLCTGTYMVLLITYTAVNYSYWGVRKTCMANTETSI